MAEAHDKATSSVDFTLLPGQLRVIAKKCGEDCMWAVWRNYGGGHLSIPAVVDAAHPIAVTLGMDYAQLLAKHFAPRTLYIAKGDGAQLAVRNKVRNLAIWAERQQGIGLFAIARKHHLSERQVINILNSLDLVASDKPQVDLFSL